MKINIGTTVAVLASLAAAGAAVHGVVRGRRLSKELRKAKEAKAWAEVERAAKEEMREKAEAESTKLRERVSVLESENRDVLVARDEALARADKPCMCPAHAELKQAKAQLLTNAELSDNELAGLRSEVKRLEKELLGKTSRKRAAPRKRTTKKVTATAKL